MASNMKLRLGCLFLLASILGACVRSPQVEERIAYWKSETDRFFRDHRNLVEVHSWLRQQDIYYTFDQGDVANGEWTVGLEKVYIDSFNCEWIDIRLHLSVTDTNQISEYRLEEGGPCLW